jgi:ABC-type spermidine/putrescine transport system permease subunit I
MNASARRYWRSREALFVLPALLFYALLYLYPLSRLGAWSVFDPTPTLKNYRELVADPVYAIALLNTLEISLWVTLAALLLGYPIAYLMTTVPRRARMWLMALVMVPFWTSILVRSFAWVVILGTNGIVNKSLIALGLVERPVKLLYNLVGVEIGMVHVLLPFMIFPLYGVMAQIDPALLRAGRSLGAPPWRTFLHVFLPLSLPGIFGGCVLVFILSLGFYITPALLGGPGDYMISMFIYVQVSELLDWGYAALLALVLLASTIVIFLIASRFVKLERIYGGRS